MLKIFFIYCIVWIEFCLRFQFPPFIYNYALLCFNYFNDNNNNSSSSSRNTRNKALRYFDQPNYETRLFYAIILFWFFSSVVFLIQFNLMFHICIKVNNVQYGYIDISYFIARHAIRLFCQESFLQMYIPKNKKLIVKNRLKKQGALGISVVIIMMQFTSLVQKE